MRAFLLFRHPLSSIGLVLAAVAVYFFSWLWVDA